LITTQKHAEEFRRWADEAGNAASDAVAAAEQMEYVNQALAAALEKLDGLKGACE
jgi:hypothetical protein